MIEKAKKILGSVKVEEAIFSDMKEGVHSIADLKQKIEEHLSQSTTNLLEVILTGAVMLQASDIHIEPQKDRVRLRLRIDGTLQDISFVDDATYHHLLSRLKLLSEIKLNISDRPQDGRFSIGIDTTLIEIRTSTLPAEYGESVVMRVLNPENLMELEHLGLRKDLYQIFLKEVQRPNGMILVTGPTGAGKTTTLYAFLMKLQNPEVKIITIEDPIEYHITGVSQTQVMPNTGYTFSEGLRSIIRQDPDVILVGEIRDLETAKIALQASLTGHLVLTTLHANDAAGTIPRLVDLGIEPPSIAPALKMVVGQRLIRKVCKHCSIKEKPSAQELAEIKKGLHQIPKSVLDPTLLADLTIARVKEGGCEQCNFTGFKDRQGIFEVFVVDDEMERFILKNPVVSDIKSLLIKRGMITIYQSGLIEVVLGNTTLEEVKKVVEADE